MPEAHLKDKNHKTKNQKNNNHMIVRLFHQVKQNIKSEQQRQHIPKSILEQPSPAVIPSPIDEKIRYVHRHHPNVRTKVTLSTK